MCPLSLSAIMLPHSCCDSLSFLLFSFSVRGLHEYELMLRADLYTGKHTQWFYFRVCNMKAGVHYRFTITNLMKKSSLYSQGMRPLLYSERLAKEKGVGWQRVGSDIRYFRGCGQVDDSCCTGICIQKMIVNRKLSLDLKGQQQRHGDPARAHLDRPVPV